MGTDPSTFKTAMNGQTLVYELATPSVIDDLSPETLSTLLGDNYIYADTGDVIELTYRANLSTILPAAPTTDGTYTLTVTVTNGAASYTWEEQ